MLKKSVTMSNNRQVVTEYWLLGILLFQKTVDVWVAQNVAQLS